MEETPLRDSHASILLTMPDGSRMEALTVHAGGEGE